MKSRIRILALTLSILILVPLLAWTAMFLYWHIRIQSALADSERLCLAVPTDRERMERHQFLLAAGCRTLPYLVRALDESKPPEFQAECAGLIVWTSMLPGWTGIDAAPPELMDLFDRWGFQADEQAEVRRRKIGLIREWWKVEGAEHHQWWRVWTAECRPYGLRR